MKLNPLHAIDFYKANHIKFYGPETTMLYNNFTPRSTKYLTKVDGTDDKIVLFGLQYFIKYFLVDTWKSEFFDQPKEKVIKKYKRRMDNALGKDAVSTGHISQLHDLGYLPITVKALPEGSVVDAKIPYFTLRSNNDSMAWLAGYLEDALSCLIWKTSTSATIARKYKKIGLDAAKKTGVDSSFVNFQFHDFQLRGCGGFQDAVMSGGGHLLSFYGTDNVPAIDFLEDYYNADSDKEMVGCSVYANEHSCVCSGKKENEFNNYLKWITETFPTGILSMVSDTWSLWNVITEYLPRLKDIILSRDGKIVIRPDSSPKTPLEIICGDPDAEIGSPEHKGVVQLLWDIFGGSVNSMGYKELDPHIGVLYGESITMKLAQDIFKNLSDKGFASNCVLMGIGSYTYVYNTRDTLGYACKATASIVDGEFREIFKDPVTDSGGMKKSARGYLRVDNINGVFVLKDQCSWEEEMGGELETVYHNGKIIREWDLSEIRERVSKSYN